MGIWKRGKWCRKWQSPELFLHLGANGKCPKWKELPVNPGSGKQGGLHILPAVIHISYITYTEHLGQIVPYSDFAEFWCWIAVLAKTNENDLAYNICIYIYIYIYRESMPRIATSNPLATNQQVVDQKAIHWGYGWWTKPMHQLTAV